MNLVKIGKRICIKNYWNTIVIYMNIEINYDDDFLKEMI